MTRAAKIALLTLALVVAVGLTRTVPAFAPFDWLLAVVEASEDGDTLNLDVACDCRTGVAGANRGDVFIISGKIFPAGTLPSGDADNDPTLAVNGVAPIGDWTCRGQNSFPFPPNMAAAYSASPFAF